MDVLTALGLLALLAGLALAVAWWAGAGPGRARAEVLRAEAAQQAVAEALAALRAEREEDRARTVQSVLALAGHELGSHLSAGEQYLDRRNEAIARQLDGVAGEVRRVNDVVVALQRERAEQHGQVLSGLGEAIRQSQAVVSTTQSLREALSSPKARGQWGERMADDVLRLAGFVEGVNYRRQTALAGGTIPDFTFLLPGGWQLHMDVKFPIDNYLRHLRATTEAERAATANQFLRDVRERVRSLSGRGYVEPGVTLGYVLLFVPNEATYGFIHEHDAQLVDVALRQNVVLCSPFTLFAVLGVVRQAVDSFALQRSTDQVLEALGSFTTQWDKFSEAVEAVGRRLDSAAKAYDDLAGPRRRQLQRVVDRVDDLRRRAPAGDGSAGPAAAGPTGPLHPDPEAEAVAEPVPLGRPGPVPLGELRNLSRRLTG
jgi:DNA recombination protein RmuC